MLRVLRGFFMSVFVAVCVVGACSSCSGGGSGSVGSESVGSGGGSGSVGPESVGSRFSGGSGSYDASEYGKGKISSSLKSIKERGHDDTATIKDDPDLMFRDPNPRVVPVEDGDVYPGMKFINSPGGYCTLGPIFVSPDGRRHGVTAGHCAVDDGKSQEVFLEDGRVFGVVVEKSDAYKEKYQDEKAGKLLSNNVPDYAFIDIDPSMKVSFKVNKSLVVDYLADGKDAAKLLPKACAYGAKTGVKKCGSIRGMAPGVSYLYVGIWAQRGDSGAPVIIQTRDGRTAYVGVLSGGSDLRRNGEVTEADAYSIFDHVPSGWVIPG